MSAAVKLSSKLAKDEETNGLDSLHDSLIENPGQVVCAIVWLDVPKVTRDIEHGTVVPTVQVKRIEPIGVVSKVPQEVVDLAATLYEERTGKSPLPFEVTEVIEGGYVNPGSVQGDRLDD